MPAFYPVGINQGESTAQVAFAGLGVQALLRGCLAAAQHMPFVDRQLQLFTQPAGQHCRLIVAALAQAFVGQRHRNEAVGTWQVFLETMLQIVRAQFRQQSSHGPFTVMFEAGDQTVDREIVQPGRDDLGKAGRLLAALRAAHA